MDEDKQPPDNDTEDGPVELDEPVETMSMKNSFGTAVGAAMLGFEQALRNDPPPEVMAAEHVPERGQVGGDDGELIIEFPDPIEPRTDK
jgi:hypothetical protein